VAALKPRSTQPRPDKRRDATLRWALFLYLCIALCPIRYLAPTDPVRYGVDNTWMFALNYAAAHHLTIGRDVFWTYGPLCYLLVPFNIGNNLARGLAFQGGLWAFFVLLLWDLFFRGGFSVRNLAVFSALIGLSVPFYHDAPHDFVCCAALILIAHARLRRGIARWIAGLAVLGLMPLIDFFGGLMAAGIAAGLVVDALLRTGRRMTRDLALVVTVPTVVAIVGGRMTFGSFRAAWGYVRSCFEFTRSYSVAMSLSGPRIELIVALEAITLLAGLIYLLLRRDCDKARFFGLVLFIPVLLSMKHGFVRQDPPHVIQLFCFLAVALALVALSIPLNERVTAIGAVAILAIFGVLWQDYVARNDPRATLGSISGIATPSLVWNALHFNRLRQSLDAEGREDFPDAKIEPQIKSIVGREPVGFLSNAYTSAVTNNLNLVLFPVLQRYAVTTPYLDHLDATWIDEKGPQFLLFDGNTIDGRHPWMDTPATWAEVYRWYDTRLLGPHDLLLERRAEPRFSSFEPVARRTVRLSDGIAMPASTEPIFWSMQCSLTEMGRVRALLFRVPPVMMDVQEKDRPTESFRVIVPMLGAPAPGNYLPSTLSQFAEVFSERDDLDFSVTHLRFRSLGRSAYQPSCGVEYFRTAHR
jgi:hypothetical protein